VVRATALRPRDATAGATPESARVDASEVLQGVYRGREKEAATEVTQRFGTAVKQGDLTGRIHGYQQQGYNLETAVGSARKDLAPAGIQQVIGEYKAQAPSVAGYNQAADWLGLLRSFQGEDPAKSAPYARAALTPGATSEDEARRLYESQLSVPDVADYLGRDTSSQYKQDWLKGQFEDVYGKYYAGREAAAGGTPESGLAFNDYLTAGTTPVELQRKWAMLSPSQRGLNQSRFAPPSRWVP